MTGDSDLYYPETVEITITNLRDDIIAIGELADLSCAFWKQTEV